MAYSLLCEINNIKLFKNFPLFSVQSIIILLCLRGVGGGDFELCMNKKCRIMNSNVTVLETRY